MTALSGGPDRWRTGRSVGRTLYIGDELVGVMDTPELARQVVEAIHATEQARAVGLLRDVVDLAMFCGWSPGRALDRARAFLAEIDAGGET